MIRMTYGGAREMTLWRAFLGGFLLLVATSLAYTETKHERSVQSPSHTVALLELYTSEG